MKPEMSTNNRSGAPLTLISAANVLRNTWNTKNKMELKKLWDVPKEGQFLKYSGILAVINRELPTKTTKTTTCCGK